MKLESHVKEYITSLATPLIEGQATGHELCPLCNGGQSRERSFIVRRIGGGGIYYQCYRATCGMGRGVLNKHGGFMAAPKEKVFIPKEYKYATRTLIQEEYEFFRTKWELQPAELEQQRVRRVPQRNSYRYPIFNELGYEIGCTDRAYWDRDLKAITYWFTDDIKLHFPLGQNRSTRSPLLVVEDQLSAIKGGRFMNTVALLGTGFNLDMAQYLSTLTNHLVMALDKDASSKAIKYERDYGILFGNYSTLLLSNDVKDTPHPQLEEILDEWKES